MKLSTKTRYALRALSELGQFAQKEGMLLKDVARRQDISMKYLDHIFSVLRLRGFIKGTGRGKGYMLNQAPEMITVFDIFETFEGPAVIDCIRKTSVCRRSHACGARGIWRRLSGALEREMRSITLRDVIEEQKKLLVRHKKNKRVLLGSAAGDSIYSIV